jgi:hypothetical protein
VWVDIGFPPKIGMESICASRFISYIYRKCPLFVEQKIMP